MSTPACSEFTGLSSQVREVSSVPGSNDSRVDSGGEAGYGHSPVQAVVGVQLDTSYHCHLECIYTSQGTTSFTGQTLTIPSTRQGQAMLDKPNLPNITINRARHQLSVKGLLKNNKMYEEKSIPGLRDAVSHLIQH